MHIEMKWASDGNNGQETNAILCLSRFTRRMMEAGHEEYQSMMMGHSARWGLVAWAASFLCATSASQKYPVSLCKARRSVSAIWPTNQEWRIVSQDELHAQITEWVIHQAECSLDDMAPSCGLYPRGQRQVPIWRHSAASLNGINWICQHKSWFRKPKRGDVNPAASQTMCKRRWSFDYCCKVENKYISSGTRQWNKWIQTSTVGTTYINVDANQILEAVRAIFAGNTKASMEFYTPHKDKGYAHRRAEQQKRIFVSSISCTKQRMSLLLMQDKTQVHHGWMCTAAESSRNATMANWLKPNNIWDDSNQAPKPAKDSKSAEKVEDPAREASHKYSRASALAHWGFNGGVLYSKKIINICPMAKY